MVISRTIPWPFIGNSLKIHYFLWCVSIAIFLIVFLSRIKYLGESSQQTAFCPLCTFIYVISAAYSGGIFFFTIFVFIQYIHCVKAYTFNIKWHLIRRPSVWYVPMFFIIKHKNVKMSQDDMFVFSIYPTNICRHIIIIIPYNVWWIIYWLCIRYVLTICKYIIHLLHIPTFYTRELLRPAKAYIYINT